ncbi:hypothetical protein [Lysinibacillus sp. FW12]|uniref:hypothetical protein n=1 Tax=Lysinibacillus sp. FW12 TaxID=3096079 RepID=UPI003D74C480
MKNYKKGWQHLHDLKLTDQQEQYLLRQITAPSSTRKKSSTTMWRIPSVALLFVVVLSILLLSFIQEPTTAPRSTDSTKMIDRIYVKDNKNTESFLPKGTCLYVPQQCYLDKKRLTQLQEKMKEASPISITSGQWESNDYFTPYDLFILYTDGSQEKWKVLNNDILFNVETQQAFLIEESMDSLIYFYDDKRSTKLIIGNIFIFLTHFILWIAKKRMPHTERRFFAVTVEHAIANLIMLLLFGGILFSIYLVQHTIHATIIYSFFLLYSIMQILYRKKAGEPHDFLIASAFVQLCLAIAFTSLYLALNVYF